MPLTVNTNLASLNGLKNLNRTSRSLNQAFGRISSGLRITRAGDDAAGLAVAENIDAATISLRQASRNTNDGISVLQTAEGATNEVANIIKRMRELAVESASETLNSTERSYIQTEFIQLRSEVDRIANATEFNGIKLGDATNTQIAVQIGIHNNANADRINIELSDLRISTGLGVTAAANLSTVDGAREALGLMDAALDNLNTKRAKFGAVQNSLEHALNNLAVYTENLQAAESQIRDADFAFETAEMAKYQIMQQAGVAVLAQANQINQGALRLLGG